MSRHSEDSRDSTYTDWRERLNEGDTFKPFHMHKIRTKLNRNSFRLQKTNSSDGAYVVGSSNDDFEEADPAKSSRQLRKDNVRQQKKMGIIVALLTGLFVAGIAAVVIVLTIGKTGSNAEEQLLQATISLRVVNKIYNSDLANKSSSAFKDFETEICKEVDHVYAGTNDYSGCVVDSLQNGSTIARLKIFFDNLAQTSNSIIFILTKGSQKKHLILGGFTIEINTIVVVIAKIPVKNKPVKTTTATSTPTITTTTAATTTATTTTSATTVSQTTTSTQPSSSSTSTSTTAETTSATTSTQSTTSSSTTTSSQSTTSTETTTSTSATTSTTTEPINVFDCPEQMSVALGDNVTVTCQLSKDLETTSLMLEYPDGREPFTSEHVSFNSTLSIDLLHITLDIVAGTVIEFHFNFTDVNCPDEGEFNVTINGEFHDDFVFEITAEPKVPDFSLYTDGYFLREVELNCSGDVGRKVNDNPQTRLIFQIKRPEDTGFTEYFEETPQSLDNSSCVNMASLSSKFVLMPELNMSEYRCVATDDTGQVLHVSDTRLVFGELPDFICDDDIHGELGSDVYIACSVTPAGIVSELSFTINNITSKVTDEEDSSLNGTHDVTHRLTADLIVGTDDVKLNLTYKNVTCTDVGSFVTRVSRMLTYTSTISVTGKPEDPKINMKEKVNNGDDVTITCSGSVGMDANGQPVGRLSLVFKGPDMQSFVFMIDVYNTTMAENCVNIQTVSRTLNGSDVLAWNNTEFKCITDDPENALESEVKVISVESADLRCPVEVSAELGSMARIDCTITGVTSPSVSVSHEGFVLYDSVNHQENGSSIEVNQTGASLIVTWVDCSDAGNYVISILSTGKEANTKLVVTSPPTEPSLNMTGSFKVNGVLSIVCRGEVGYPFADFMSSIELRFQDDPAYNEMDDVMVETTNESCHVIKESRVIVTSDAAWKNASVRCRTSKTGGEEFLSESQIVDLQGLLDIFLDKQAYTALVGEELTVTCIDNGTLAAYSVFQIGHIADSLADSATQVILGKLINSSIVEQINRTDVTVRSQSNGLEVTFTSVQCADEGLITCHSDQGEDTVTFSKLHVTGTPGTPILNMSSTFVQQHTPLPVKCSGNVGRGDNQESLSSVELNVREGGEGEFSIYSGYAQRQNQTENCNILETATFELLLTSNNTEIKCVTKSRINSTALHESSVQAVQVGTISLTCIDPAPTFIGSDLSVTCSTSSVITLTSLTVKGPDGDTSSSEINGTTESVVVDPSLDVYLGIPNNNDLLFNFTIIDCADAGLFNVTINEGLEASFNVTVISDVETPTLTGTFNVTSSANCTCTGSVGRNDEGNQMAELSVEVKKTTEQNFTVLEPNVSLSDQSDCEITQTVFVYVTVDDTWNGSHIRCVATDSEDGTRNEGDVETLIVVPLPKVSFSDWDPIGTLDASYSFMCEAEDIPSLSQIALTKHIEEFYSVVASYHNDTLINSTSSINQHRTKINGNHGELVVEVLILGCDDEGEYMCTAATDGLILYSDPKTLAIQRHPDTLSLTVPILPFGGNHDYNFTCTGQVGVPPGRLVLQSTENSTGFSDISTKTNQTIEKSNCSNVANIILGRPIQTSKSEVSYRCAVKDTEGFVLAVSDEQSVAVVSGDICINQANEREVQVPEDCHGYVTCVAGTPIGSPVMCPNEECFSSARQACVVCTVIGGCDTEVQPDEFTCTSPITVEMGGNGTFECILNSPNTTLANVSVSKEDGTFTITALGVGEHIDGDVRVEVTDLTVCVTVVSVECDDQQRVVVAANDKFTSWSKFDIENHVNSTPTPTVIPNPPLNNAFLQASCTAEFGTPVGVGSVTIEQNTGDGSFKSVSGVTSHDVAQDCVVTKTTAKLYTDTDQSWNGTQFRCKSQLNESLAMYSDILMLVGTDSPTELHISANNLTMTSGMELNITCTITGDDDLQNITIFKFTDEQESDLAVVNTKGATDLEDSDGVDVSSGHWGNGAGSLTVFKSDSECTDEANYACIRNGNMADPHNKVLEIHITDCP